MDECGCGPNERYVWIAEDATAILTRVEYKSDDDQVIGFVSPLNPGTGLPEIKKFPATSVSVVHNYFEQGVHDRAKSVYALVAIPLNAKATPYVLVIFGTQNKFSHQNVLDR